MSKRALIAASYMGSGAAYRIRALDIDEDDDIIIGVAAYAELAVELTDAAKLITFAEPDNMPYLVYDRFGDDYAEYAGEDDDNNLPDTDWCHEKLVDLVYENFKDLCSNDQKASLKRALEAVIEAQ